MEFFNSIKKWFYSNNSSAASSDARIPLLTSTGEPKGSDTMANIVNVLGVNTVAFESYHLLTSNDDLNDIKTPGLYVVSDANAPAHCPSWGGFNSLIFVYKWGASPYEYKRLVQIMIEANTATIGYRTGSQDGFGGSWRQIAVVS